MNLLKNYTEVDAMKVLNDQRHFKEKDFEYSNFAYGTLGLIIEKVTNQKYKTILEKFLVKHYGVRQTCLWTQGSSYQNKNLYDWGADNFYQPAGAVISNIEDMMVYLKMSMQRYKSDVNFYRPLKKVKTNFEEIWKFGINFDAVAYGWLEDTGKNIIAHPGELPTSTSFIGFEPHKEIGIVILVNQEPSNEVFAKFLGAKLLNELSQ